MGIIKIVIVAALVYAIYDKIIKPYKEKKKNKVETKKEEPVVGTVDKQAEAKRRMNPPQGAIFTGPGKNFTLGDVKVSSTKKHMLNKVESAKETVNLRSVKITTRGITCDWDAPQKVKDEFKAGNFGIIFEDESGQIHAGTWEWMRKGQKAKLPPLNVDYDFKHPASGEIITMGNIGKHIKVNGMKNLWFKEGSKIGFFVVLDNARTDNIGSDDISNVVTVTLTDEMIYPKDISSLVI